MFCKYGLIRKGSFEIKHARVYHLGGVEKLFQKEEEKRCLNQMFSLKHGL